MAQERIEAPLPGKILRVEVSAGNQVAQGGVVCIIESMKMENPILTPAGGHVKEVRVKVGDMVRSGQLIAVIEH